MIPTKFNLSTLRLDKVVVSAAKTLEPQERPPPMESQNSLETVILKLGTSIHNKTQSYWVLAIPTEFYRTLPVDNRRALLNFDGNETVTITMGESGGWLKERVGHRHCWGQISRRQANVAPAHIKVRSIEIVAKFDPATMMFTLPAPDFIRNASSLEQQAPTT